MGIYRGYIGIYGDTSGLGPVWAPTSTLSCMGAS